jgi:hypothetical protein
MPAGYKYANFSEFQYQTPQLKYQTYDYEKSQFTSYHISESTDRLTSGNDQDNKEDPNTTESKEDALTEPAVEEPGTPPAEESESPESAGKYDCNILIEDYLNLSIRRVTHLKDRINRGNNTRRTS